MSSTQGHTNIHTVHTTVDISVLLGEINRIADESYSEGFESGYDVGMKKGKADAIEEFEPLLDLLVGFESECICDEMCSSDYCDENCKYDCPQKECYLQYIKWQKGAE